MYRRLLSAWPDPAALLSGELPAARADAVDRAFVGGAGLGLLDRMMLADQSAYLPEDLLAKVDRASMAVSLEVRVPLLDHRVVEFGWTLPASLKVRGGTGKWILRRVLERYVPRELIDRPKIGFTVPIADWLRGPLRPWAEDLLADLGRHDDGLFDRPTLLRAWRDFQHRRRALGLGLWAVIHFQAWRARWAH
jgi:asparagine synthase (glutamine-hydrolysing)